jgi:hypothetical protein
MEPKHNASSFFLNLKTTFKDFKKVTDVDNVVFYLCAKSQFKIPYIRSNIEMAKSDRLVRYTILHYSLLEVPLFSYSPEYKIF